MPKFSVIIPNFNHASFLTERISSVLMQTFTDFEVIILDDCSTDNSKEIIEQFRGNKKISSIVYNDTNTGSPFQQWAKGILLATGEWIWIAESDDIANPSFLEKINDQTNLHPVAGLIYTDSKIINNEGLKQIPGNYAAIKNNFLQVEKWDHPYFQHGINELNDSLKYFCSINNVSAAVIKKNVAQSVIENSKLYLLHGDWQFYIGICKNADIAYIPESLNAVRIHSSSHLNKNKNLQRSRLEHFFILESLLEIKELKDKKKVIAFFAEQHLGFGFIRNGIANGLRIPFLYLHHNFKLGCKVLTKVLFIKLTRKKIKHIF